MTTKQITFFPLLLAASFGLGHWHERRVMAGVSDNPRRVLYYRDPMHPAYRSERPGTAPDCGMDLEPVYAGGASPSTVDGLLEHPPGTVRINPEQQQLIGVKVGVAERMSGENTFRTVGIVTPDEACVYRLTARVDGWVRQIYPNATGALVQKGQRLLSVYSRDLQTAQQAYLFALNQLDRFKNGDEPDAVGRLKIAARDAQLNLESLGMSGVQIEAIARTKSVLPQVDLVAPATGFITMRNLYADQKFEKGAELYRIVDLSRVWIAADLPGQEDNIPAGTVARVSVPHSPEAVFKARVAATLPQIDPVSRTIKVRLLLDNPHLVFKPDMYVDVEFTKRMAAGVAVPLDAILDSGRRKLVFVDRGGGYFEPRQVITGPHYGERVVIERGLAAGERIATSGTFLIDSESRLKTAAAGMQPESTVVDPVCAMPLADPASAKRADRSGKTYLFCSERCRRKFEADPARYAKTAAHPDASGPA